MRLVFTILIILTAQTTAHSQTVSFSGKNVPLKKVFTVIEQQTGYLVFYKKELLSIAKPVSLSVANISLPAFLDMLIKEQPLNYKITNKTIVFSKKNDDLQTADLKSAVSNLIDIHGRIVNEAGEPVTATITVKGTKIAAGTNIDGVFQLTDVPENAVLIITGVTIETLELKSNVNLERITVKTKVKEEETVVVANTGYQKVST